MRQQAISRFSYSTQETEVPCFGNFWYVFKRFSSCESRHTLYWALQSFPINRCDDFLFQYKVIYNSSTMFTLNWQKVGMSSPIQGENISRYHSNSRCSFICFENITIQYRVFPVLGFMYFPVQGGNILQFKVAPVLDFGCTTSHDDANTRSWVPISLIPIQGHKSQYKVTIFCNSRFPCFVFWWYYITIQ